MVMDVLWAFFTGLAGSLHCMGMCGPLVIAYSLHLSGKGSRAPGFAYHHVLFHLGRIAAYALIGAVAAGLIHLLGFSKSLIGARSVISLCAGFLMVVFGLVLVKIVPFPFIGTPGHTTFYQNLFSSNYPGSKWLIGFGAGFLPCMLSWAMVVKAASTANPLTAFLVMALFGLGTVPILLSLGVVASFLTVRIRLAGERIAGFSVIAMGLILLWKGAVYLGW